MALDSPWIDYGSGRKKGSHGGGSKKSKQTNLTAAQADAMWAQWEKDRGGKTFSGKKGLSIGDIFGE